MQFQFCPCEKYGLHFSVFYEVYKFFKTLLAYNLYRIRPKFWRSWKLRIEMYLHEQAKWASYNPVFTQSAVRSWNLVNPFATESCSNFEMGKKMYKTGKNIYIFTNQIKYGLHCPDFHETRQSLNNKIPEFSRWFCGYKHQSAFSLPYAHFC
jgi:hypothetical protein